MEQELTAQELHLEWSAVMEKEYERLKEAHKQGHALQKELHEVEENWTPKLEDAVDEIELLKTRLEERDRDELAANEKSAALPKESKGRGNEIAAMHEAVANMKKGKGNKEVEAAVRTEIKGVLVAGTQPERCTYASILAQTEELSIGGENTYRMDIDTLPPPTDKPTSPAATPSANTTNTPPHLPTLQGLLWVMESRAVDTGRKKYRRQRVHSRDVEGESLVYDGSYKAIEGGERRSARWLSLCRG